MKAIFHFFTVLRLLTLVESHNVYCPSIYEQPGFVLQNYVFLTVISSSQRNCQTECGSHQHCYSVNYYTGKNKCQLSNATHLSKPTHLAPDEKGMYSYLKGDYCSDMYCNTGQICLLGRHGNEHYTCTGCNFPKQLGMQSRKIPDSAITASSFFGVGHEPWRGRLKNQPKLPYKVESDIGCWKAGKRAAGEYLQVDLGGIYPVAMVATQGRPMYYNMWVTKYSLSCASTKDNFVDYTVGGAVKVFDGNTDYTSIVKNKLPGVLRCRYIRIVVVQYNNNIAMRAEIYSCAE